MRRRAAWRWQDAPILLGLCLWMAMPAFQWCSMNEASCRAAMGMPCEAMSTNGGGGSTCPLEGECPLRPPSDGSRIWCVGPSTDGVTPKEIAAPFPDAPLPFAVLVDPGVQPSPPSRAELPAERSGLCSGLTASHAPPLTRAPPLLQLHFANSTRPDRRVGS